MNFVRLSRKGKVMNKKYKIRKYSIAWFAVEFWDMLPILLVFLAGCRPYR